jgi:hypothetical protein
MVDPNSMLKTAWNVLMLILVVFQSVVVPVRIAFEDETPLNWLVADYIQDVFFLVDVLINFNTALINDKGELVTARKTIARVYLKGWFWIDFLSVVPITLIFEQDLESGGSSNASRFVKLAKLPRIYRILRVVKMIKIFKTSKALQLWYESIQISKEAKQIIASFITMAFLLHMVGCFFAITGNISEGFGYESWIQANGLTGLPIEE